MFDLNEMLSRVDQRKAELDAYRPLSPLTASSLRKKLALDWTYHSNAIEGNTLTLRETKVVLEDGITIGKKSMREHFEAINHRDAILFVEDLVSKVADINEWNIKNIHQLVYKNIDNEVAGRYRTENVVITGAGFTPPDHFHLPEKMAELIRWYHTDAKRLHPIDRASQLHTRFVEIHPFEDGNGRTARLLLNFELMREGYPVTIIRKEDRLEYFDALEKSCVDREYSDFTRMVAEGVARSLDLYLEIVTGKKPEPMVGNNSDEYRERLSSLSNLEQCGGAAYTFWRHADEAIKAAGSPDKVNWPEIERQTIAKSIGEHGQLPDNVADALCKHSPGAVSSGRQADIRADIKRLTPQLQVQYEQSRTGKASDVRDLSSGS
jgi:fido (protein-threonine AMPylation protein)